MDATPTASTRNPGARSVAAACVAVTPRQNRHTARAPSGAVSAPSPSACIVTAQWLRAAA